jgi:hypothetical protein
MKAAIQLDIIEAIRLRDGGIKEAIDHAEAIEPKWGDQALSFLKGCRVKGIFQVEDIRKLAEEIGFPSAPDARAWGSVIRKAASLDLVEKVGIQSKASTICHRGFASLWQFKVNR